MNIDKCTGKKFRGRPAQFDRDLLVGQVMELFWERGYKNLSLNEIARQTGITRASLYNAFTTKEALFFEAMHHYFNDSPAHLLESIKEGDQVGPILHRFFESIAKILASDCKHRGCLVVNCLSECSQEDAVLLAQLEDFFTCQHGRFKILVKQAIYQKELPAETDCEITAAAIQAFLNGFSIYSKHGASYEKLSAISGLFLGSLGFAGE